MLLLMMVVMVDLKHVQTVSSTLLTMVLSAVIQHGMSLVLTVQL